MPGLAAVRPPIKAGGHTNQPAGANLAMDKLYQKPPTKILFVCVGNSCRSQMAEAIANFLGAGRIQVWSAGSHPLGSIFPHTRTVLEEQSISIDEQWSKGLRDVPVTEMDMVVSMGSEVEFPLPSGFTGRLVEWEIPDPYGYELDSYRVIRDLIGQKVAALLDKLQNTCPSQTPGNAQRDGLA